jgi:transcriptional regulator with XRE-family HTH domain
MVTMCESCLIAPEQSATTAAVSTKAIGQAVRLLREDRGWTQAELAEKLGITQSTLSAKERGDVEIKRPEQRKLAEVFGISFDDFEGMWRGTRIERTKAAIRGIPVINRAPAGIVSDYEEYGVDSSQGYEYLDAGDIYDDLAFAVVVVGNSMEPELREGDYAIFTPMTVPRPRQSLENGDIVFVRFTPESGREGCMLSRYYRQDNGVVVLRKDNPGHPPTVCRTEDIQQLSVLIELRRKPKRR